MLQQRQDAEDMCQEVFVKAIQTGFESIENQKPWLLSITMNMCRNHLKRKNKEVLLNRLKQIFAPVSVENTFECKELQSELQSKLQQLPERIRSVLVLKYLHQMKNEEVAQILHIPIGTVKSRCNKGLKKMRQLIQSQDSFQIELRGGFPHV
jgi:RNA polymerase sigma-70 factor, ECF subfamily